jgi:hypothetical protein
MTVFYRSQELLISRDAFVPLFSPDQFALADLRRIQVSRGASDTGARRLATNAAVGALALVATVGLLTDAPRGWALAVVGIVGTAALALISHAVRRPRWQLQAEHNGATILLYSTTDERTFGQVKRALVRALEANAAAGRRHVTGLSS